MSQCTRGTHWTITQRKHYAATSGRHRGRELHPWPVSIGTSIGTMLRPINWGSIRRWNIQAIAQLAVDHQRHSWNVFWLAIFWVAWVRRGFAPGLGNIWNTRRVQAYQNVNVSGWKIRVTFQSVSMLYKFISHFVCSPHLMCAVAPCCSCMLVLLCLCGIDGLNYLVFLARLKVSGFLLLLSVIWW